MQSGTVLHLALLKKLSNHYPNGQLRSKYHQFKQNYSTRCSSRSPKHPTIQKYESYEKNMPFEGGSKPRRCRLQRKFQKVFERWQLQDSVTAWNIDNQQQVSYTEKLKRNKYELFPKLIESQKKNSNKIFFKKKCYSRQAFIIDNKAHNFLVQEINKAPTSCLIKRDKFSAGVNSRKLSFSQDKENYVQLKPIVSGYKHKRRTKSNDRLSQASPLSKNISNTLVLKD